MTGTLPDALQALVAEVALKQAHELDGNRGGTDGTLATSTGAAESLGLGFHLGAAMERIAVAAGEGSEGGPRLREAAWLIERYITLLEERPLGADVHAASSRLTQTGGAIAAETGDIAAALAPEEPPTATQETPPEAPMPPQIVHELPSMGHELLITAARAAIYVAAITLVVLLLTLIAQWL